MSPPLAPQTLPIPAADIFVPDDLAREIDAAHVEVLRQSKKRGGILPQPIVMPEGSRYRLLIHAHCFRALTADGEKTVEVRVVNQPLQPREYLLGRVLENGIRKDFTITELLRNYIQLMKEWGWDQSELADALRKSRKHVNVVLGRGERLHPEVFALYAAGGLKGRAADATMRLPREQQVEFVARTKGWKVERVEAEAAKLQGNRVRQPRPTKIKSSGGLTVLVPPDFDNDRLEQEIKELLKRSRRGRGDAPPPIQLPDA